jgi:hypothetical protein
LIGGVNAWQLRETARTSSGHHDHPSKHDDA